MTVPTAFQLALEANRLKQAEALEEEKRIEVERLLKERKHKPPMEHQIDVRSHPLDQLILLGEPGSGKTIAGIQFVDSRNHYNQSMLTVCVVPDEVASGKKDVLGQFSREIVNQRLDKTQVYEFGRRQQPTKETVLGFKELGINVWMVITYNTLKHDETRAYLNDLLPYFKTKTLLVDEVHSVKNWETSTQSRVTSTFAKGFTYHCGLTATSIERLLTDWYGQIATIIPDHRWVSWGFYEFQRTFTRQEGWGSSKRINKPTGYAMLMEELAPYVIAHKKAEIRKDMPLKHRRVELIKTPDKVAFLLRKLGKNIGWEVELNVPARIKWDGTYTKPFTYTEFMANMNSYRMFVRRFASLHGHKLEWLYDNYPNPTEDNPIFVATVFRDTAIEIAKHYGVTPILGGVKNVNDLKYQRVVVGTLAKVRQAISLGHIKTAIIFDGDWSSISRLQVEDRIHRIDSEGDVDVISLVNDIEIDDDILKALDYKFSSIDALDDAYRQMNERYGTTPSGDKEL